MNIIFQKKIKVNDILFFIYKKKNKQTKLDVWI